MKVDNLTPVLTAAPGERATCRLRIENTEAAPVLYRMRVIGFDEGHVLQPAPNGPLPAGGIEEVALEFVIPDAFAAGHHSVAVEVFADRPGVAPAIAAVTVTVGTIDDVALAVVPSTIRAHRRGSFRVDIDNRSNRLVDLELAGEGPDLRVRLSPDRLVLRPGERVRTSGKVKGPRHVVGEPLQHSMTVTARSSSSPSYAPATFQQRPLFPRGLRSMIAVLLVVAIWAGAVAAGFLWWNSRQDEVTEAPAELVDTDGDGVPDTPGDQLIDTDGDGVPDTLAAVVADQVAAAGGVGPPQEGGGDRPTRTVVGGTVKAGDSGDDAGVAIALTPIELGAAPPTGAAPAGFAGGAGQGRGVKLWPARFGRYEPPGALSVRQTVSIQSAASGPDGAWRFADVAIGQHYELSFARPGFDTQSFVVTPPPDGEPVELDVVLEPSSGSISGVVVGPGGPLANVELVLTDGTLTFHTSSASGTGAFLITGVSTPGTFTLTATLRGHGTEVVQVRLEPGEQRTGVRIAMTPGVGSISGRVSENGQPLGGVTLTASAGDVTRTTTSLTEGDRGLYTFPQLAIPGRYTVTASLDGYVTQSRVVSLGGNVTGVDFAMVKTTGAITGIVESSNGGPLTGANIRVGRDELFFDTNSAVAPDPGSFTITDLPPGTFLVAFSRFDHVASSQLVTVGPGQIVDLGRIVLQFRDRPNIPETGSLEVNVVGSRNEPLTGAEVSVIDVATGEVVAELSDEGVDRQSTFVFDPLPIGTYRVDVVKRPDYRRSSQRVSIGLGRETVVAQLFKLGQVFGRIVDADEQPLTDYAVQIFRVSDDDDDDNDTPVGDEIAVVAGSPPVGPDDDVIGWESPPNAPLTTGLYRIEIVDRPPGYRVLDQVLVDGLDPMQFEVRADDDEPIELLDLRADLNPSLTGQVVVPRLDPGTGETRFVPVNDDGLAVSLRCGTNEFALDPANGDQLFSADGDPALDSYLFSAVVIEENSLNGVCEITVGVQDAPFDEGELVTVTKALPSPLLPASPTQTGSIDKVVNVALVPARAIAGHAYWTDVGAAPPNGAPVDATDFLVRTLGAVIIGFDPRDDDLDPEAPPFVTQLDASTDDAGRWIFDAPKQVFGTTTYEVSSPGRYEPRSFPLTVGEGGRSVPEPGLGELALADGLDGVSVELDAIGGNVIVDVAIRTIKGTAAFPASSGPDMSRFTWEVTNGVTLLTDDEFTANPGPHQWQALVTTADPGTYEGSITFDTDRYVPFAGASPTGIPVDQAPASDVVVGRDFVELADLAVGVVDVGDPDAAVAATVTVAHVQSGVPGDPGPSSEDQDTVGNVALFPGLAVNGANPESSAVRYQVTPTDVPGFDTTDGSYTLQTETGTSDPIDCTDCAVDVDLRAGGQQAIAYSFPAFGSISGNVIGVVDAAGNTEPLTLGGTPPVEITATRIADESGPVLPEAEWTEEPVTAAGAGFRVSGPPGYYTIEVDHPEYEALTVAGTPATRIELVDQNGVTHFAWLMTNADDNPAGTWTLEIEKGSLDINANQDTITGAPISGATIVLTDPDGNVIPVEPTGTDGRRVVEGLFPVDYTIEIRRVTAADEDEFFPVIASVAVPRGADPAARARIVRAPLPRIGGWVAGLIVARNTINRPVPVPAVTIDRSYTPPAVETEAQGTVATVPNEATEGDVDRSGWPPAPSVTTTGSADGTPERYEFANLATGAHLLSFDAADGYHVTPGDQTVTVTDTDPPDPPDEVNADESVYIATNREAVLVTVETPSGDPVTDATVSLVSPAGGDPLVESDNVDGVYTFLDVPPDLGQYTATARKPLHEDASVSFVVPPGVGDFSAPDPIQLPAAVAEITGVARRQQTPLQTPPFPPLTGADGGLVRLIALTSGDEVASIVPDGTGRYVFGLLAGDLTGQYQVRVEATGYAARASAAFTPVAGSLTTVPDVVVPALATFTVRVAGPPTAGIEVVIAEPAGQLGNGPTSVSGRDSVFRVDPDFAYRFTASAPGFVSQTVPATAVDPAIGQTVPRIDVTLQRTITGTVTPPAEGTVVRATSPGQTTLTDTTDAAGAYRLVGAGAGPWTIVAERLGTGRGSIERTIATNGPAVTGADIALVARPVRVTFTLDPATATVTLSNGGSGTGATVTLDVAENAFPVGWRATAPGRIPQGARLERDVTETDTFGLEVLTQVGPSITLDPPIASATVDDPDGDPVDDATVVMCPGPTGACTTATTGAVTLPFDIDFDVYAAAVTAAGQWRIAATHADFDPAPQLTFTVAPNGSITPLPPFALQLVAPPP